MKFISYFDAQEAFEDDKEFKDRALILLSEVDKMSTYTGASAVDGVLYYWTGKPKKGTKLNVYECGEQVNINDYYVTTENPRLFNNAVRDIHESLKFDVKELTDKLRSEGFNVPAFLLAKHREPPKVGLKTLDWKGWLNRKQINLDECLLLAMGENPHAPDINQYYDEDKYIELRDKAEQWILSRELQAIGELNNGSQEYKNIEPLSFFKLARLNGWFLPKPVNDWLDNRLNQQNVIWSGEIEPLEPLTEEQKQTYNSRTAWTWVDAIYILQGYKPVYQLSTEQVRSHFPQQVHDFTDSIDLGSVGKLRERAGERTHIDSPANWQAYWQGINKQSENVSNLGAGSLIIDWYHRIGHMPGDISQTIGTEPMSINWPHWLSLPSWSKKQAVLLACGLNPNKFHEIERHENYQSMCEPFIELCQRTIEESGTPYYWLNKFNIESYLGGVPRGVHEWLAQQIERTQLEPQAETVANVGVDSQGTEQNGKALTKLEKQQAAILEVIKAKEFNPMAIPDGEKGIIKIICENDYKVLFEAVTAFERAWKDGINKLWKMEHHESYAHRGK